MKQERSVESASAGKDRDDPSENNNATEIWEMARSIMSHNWRNELGYTAPNIESYPACWLWDSCFHSIIWLTLGDQAKAVTELSSVFRWQLEDGFVPHMGFQFNPGAATSDWRQPGHSDITQPPMFGHAIRMLHEAGIDVTGLVEKAAAAFDFLMARRRAKDGMLFIIHPSEAGCGSSPRWDSWAKGKFDPISWKERKSELASLLVYSPYGSSISSSQFIVESAAFNALTAFNMIELYHVAGNEKLLAQAESVITALDRTWDEELDTWKDVTSEVRQSSSARTAEALLPVLVSRNKHAVSKAFKNITSGGRLESRFGVAGTDKTEQFFDPGGYWRGAGWPQLNYLFWVAAMRSGRREIADELAAKSLGAATASDYSEYFNSMTGQGLGAKPQSWACLPICMLDKGK